ncbi:MAG: prepilin-type N-terminal cleavage/methylation domain-containing protein, partial [Pseudomonadota bacterium]
GRPRMSRAPVLRRAQAGFSLLEVLITTGILAGAAYVALSTVEIDTGRHRYEMTEQRLDAIRRALAGEPGLVANGAPVVSGYVADVGQLPPCLQALVEREADCDDDGTADFSPQAYALTDDVIAFGWRGPYLSARDGAYPDAWGNGDATPDFGWAVTATGAGPVTDIDVVSLGRDRAVGDTLGDGGFDQDETQTVGAVDVTVPLVASGLAVAFSNDTAAPLAYCAALAVPDPADLTDWTYIVGTSAPVTIPDGDSLSIPFSAAATATIGARVLAIYDSANANVNAVDCAIDAGFEDDVFTAAETFRFPVLIAPYAVPAASFAARRS